MRNLIITLLVLIASQAASHSGGVNKQGCHSGSQPYHCHKVQQVSPSVLKDTKILTGTITHEMIMMTNRWLPLPAPLSQEVRDGCKTP